MKTSIITYCERNLFILNNIHNIYILKFKIKMFNLLFFNYIIFKGIINYLNIHYYL